MKHKKPYWFKWQHVCFVNSVGFSDEKWVWKNRYKTEKARDEALKNIKKKGHRINEIGLDK